MSDQLKQTIRIVRPAGKDADVGGNETVELELVSTMMLESILESNDQAAKQKIRDLAANDAVADGVLARDAESDSFEIVDADGSPEFSLVTTQMLNRTLRDKDKDVNSDEIIDSGPSFDPYNSDG
mgnify:CR=1 FL=1